jgi:hypothetical protein
LDIQEPELQPDDTQPRKPVTIAEPSVASGDTQPTPAQNTSGCANRLLVVVTIVGLLGLFVVTVGLAAFAGLRDGQQLRSTVVANTQVAEINDQATRGAQDITQGNYEGALLRCGYVMTLQPNYPNVGLCAQTAQAMLSATPTFTPSATFTPRPPTATPTTPPAPTTGADTGASVDSQIALAEHASLTNDYERARAILEAVRGRTDLTDAQRAKIDDDLFNTYLALAEQYKFDNDLSSMVIVIKAAQKIRSIDNTQWPAELDAAELYLSAKGYYDALNYVTAAKVFPLLLTRYGDYGGDSKAMACTSFAKVGDSADAKTFKC